MDSLYNEVLSELKDLLKDHDHDSMAGWYQDGRALFGNATMRLFFIGILNRSF